MRGREAVGRAWIVDFLGALDQPGRLLRRVFDRNDLVIFSVLGNARRGVTRIVLATTGRPPYASALTAPATAKAVFMSDWHTASFPVAGSMDGASKPTPVNRRPVHVRLERGNLIFRDTGSVTTWR